jgi:hypothetical protein
MRDSAREFKAARRTLTQTERELRADALAKNTFAARWRLRGLRTEIKKLRRELISANREARHQRSMSRAKTTPDPAERRRKTSLLRASKAESADRKRLIDDAGRIVTTINERLRGRKSQL